MQSMRRGRAIRRLEEPLNGSRAHLALRGWRRVRSREEAAAAGGRGVVPAVCARRTRRLPASSSAHRRERRSGRAGRALAGMVLAEAGASPPSAPNVTGDSLSCCGSFSLQDSCYLELKTGRQKETRFSYYQGKRAWYKTAGTQFCWKYTVKRKFIEK